MNKQSPRPSAPLLSALALLLLPLAHNALAEPRVFFFDDFNGSALDAGKWETAIGTTGLRYAEGRWIQPPPEADYGSILVADSRLTLESPSPTASFPLFPVLWTNQAIPRSGDFELEFRMRYINGGFWGDGIRIVTMPSPLGPPSLGSTESPWGEYVFMVHQDGVDCKGPQVTLSGYPSTGGSSFPFNADWHTYKLRYEGDKSSFYVDDVFVAGPISTPRPNLIQLGVPGVGVPCTCCGCQWTSCSIDFLRVAYLAPTSTRKSSWGDLKVRYR